MNPAFAQTKLRFTISPAAKYLPQQIAKAELAITQAGFTSEIVELPARQALSYVLKGQFDGSLMRHPEAQPVKSELVQVPDPIDQIDYWMATRSGRTCPKNKTELWANWRPISVRGILIFEAIFKPSQLPAIEVETVRDAFASLLTNKGDFIALPKTFELESLKHLDNALQFCFSEAIYSSPLYIYLHPRHREIAVLIAAQLKLIKP
ncbi:hypothetical protein DBZ36_10560 [Alginatibacterium sediminis]|uniref:Solute-binding protein family 3/N-terminal domain-containing protein n=2 Tax=Alginatibacterium sediminis TaxID=2164068 RepID=A0A420EDR8_9ALTE|nr:hypothetical protein DBZ36_10560 [Alginatibacterium sediminis]